MREEDRKKGTRIPKGDRPSRAPDPILSPAKCIISGEKEYEVISACRGCSRQAVYLAAYSTCKPNVKAKSAFCKEVRDGLIMVYITDIAFVWMQEKAVLLQTTIHSEVNL